MLLRERGQPMALILDSVSHCLLSGQFSQRPTPVTQLYLMARSRSDAHVGRMENLASFNSTIVTLQ